MSGRRGSTKTGGGGGGPKRDEMLGNQAKQITVSTDNQS